MQRARIVAVVMLLSACGGAAATTTSQLSNDASTTTDATVETVDSTSTTSTTTAPTTTTPASTSVATALTTTTIAPTTTLAGSADVVIADIRYDGPGNDVEPNDSEYVLLRNQGTAVADVSGWSLTDEADHRITIPAGYSIEPGGELRIHTGPGGNTATSYYEGRGQAIWNNSGGDTATLRDKAGAVIDTYSYSS